MNGTAHAIMGACIGSLAIQSIQPDVQETAMIMCVSVVGALAPDIENVHSIIGRRFPITARILNFLFGHRGALHTPAFLLVLWCLLYRFRFSWLFCSGYAGHLIQDLFTAGGIPVFFPFSSKKVSLSPFRTGGIFDYVITFLLISLIYQLAG